MGERQLKIKEQRAIISCLLILEEFLNNFKGSPSHENAIIIAGVAIRKMDVAIKILDKTFQELDKEKYS